MRPAKDFLMRLEEFNAIESYLKTSSTKNSEVEDEVEGSVIRQENDHQTSNGLKEQLYLQSLINTTQKSPMLSHFKLSMDDLRVIAGICNAVKEEGKQDLSFENMFAMVKDVNHDLKSEAGVFPNFDFIRALKQELQQDEGSIFCYAHHENTYLNVIYIQLKNSNEEDKTELCEWIRSISRSGQNTADKWPEGYRCMVDMCELVKQFYYNPLTKGSNSIKKVLPAILESSSYLQKKYKEPIYGSSKGIGSRNFQNKIWVEYDKDRRNFVYDPYKTLPPLFNDIEQDVLQHFLTGEQLADGGAAMTAYARLQFTEMSPTERELVTKGLLKYCELDTLAMAMIMEGWLQQIRS